MADGQEDQGDVIAQLESERDSLDPSYVYCRKLLDAEIEKVKSGSSGADNFIEAHTAKPTKVSVKVLLPVKYYPKYNFVGKLLGPGGNTLKGIQQQSFTRMAVQGRGSTKDKSKEEELRQQGGKFAHLNQDLHLQIDAFAKVSDAYHRIGDALEAIQPYINPELNDDNVNRAQMDMGGFTPSGRGRGRGGRGGGSLLAPPAGRGAPPPLELGYDDYSGGYAEPQQSYSDYSTESYGGGDRGGGGGGYASHGARGGGGSSYNSYGGGGGRGGGRGKPQGGGWGGSANGGGYKAAPPGRGRGGERPHPYGRGRGRGGQ